jgi:hypothetical protein
VAARPEFVTNFLGVSIDPKFCPQILEKRRGRVEDIPIPGNWHADMAERTAALRAVLLAERRFTIVELGCGWGYWMKNAGTAARRCGLDVQLVGVEGDEGHIQFAREALRINGFEQSEVVLYHGVAAAEKGVALFPPPKRSGRELGIATYCWSLRGAGAEGERGK